MKKNFIFAEDIKAVLRDGTRKISIPENSRFSAAALDLIKENGVEVIYTSLLQGQPADTTAADAPAAEKTIVSAENNEDSELKETPRSDGPVTEEMVEQIARRVIERFRELRGKPAAAPSQDEQSKDSEDGDDMVICRCEEITRAEIKEAIRNGMKTLNGIKRVTRAGMGLCQGQTCQRLVTQILAGELGIGPAQIKQVTPRAPVRPVRLSVLAAG